MNESEPIDWSVVSPEMASLIHSQAEKHLTAQLTSALASDQRATTFASILASISAAVLAGCAALWETLEGASLAAGFTVSISLLVAAIFGAWAARPIDFFMPGARPEQFAECREQPLAQVLGQLSEIYQHDIDENEEFMAGNQKALRLGLVFALSSPILGIITWHFAT